MKWVLLFTKLDCSNVIVSVFELKLLDVTEY